MKIAFLAAFLAIATPLVRPENFGGVGSCDNVQEGDRFSDTSDTFEADNLRCSNDVSCTCPTRLKNLCQANGEEACIQCGGHWTPK